MYVTIYYVIPSSIGDGIMSSGSTRMQLDTLPLWLREHPGAMVTRIDQA